MKIVNYGARPQQFAVLPKRNPGQITALSIQRPDQPVAFSGRKSILQTLALVIGAPVVIGGGLVGMVVLSQKQPSESEKAYVDLKAKFEIFKSFDAATREKLIADTLALPPNALTKKDHGPAGVIDLTWSMKTDAVHLIEHIDDHATKVRLFEQALQDKRLNVIPSAIHHAFTKVIHEEHVPVDQLQQPEDKGVRLLAEIRQIREPIPGTQPLVEALIQEAIRLERKDLYPGLLFLTEEPKVIDLLKQRIPFNQLPPAFRPPLQPEQRV